MKRTLKFFLYFLAFLLLLSICLIEPIDRRPYAERPFFTEMNTRLDSLKSNYKKDTSRDSLKIGFSKISITPTATAPLAGYGARKPMEFDKVLDEVFVRAIVLKNGEKQVAILSADLLIIHPEISRALLNRLMNLGWHKNDIYLGATHSHSSVGGWAEGMAGEIFAGEFDATTAPMIVDKMVEAIAKASQDLMPTMMSYANSEVGTVVRNRLMNEGEEDAYLRNLFFSTSGGWVEISAFAAHATCFGRQSHALTGDYPSYFHSKLSEEPHIRFSMFMAGAVASMAPDIGELRDQPAARLVGHTLAEQVVLLAQLGLSTSATSSMESFRLKVPMRSPQLKVSRNLRIRPWVFNALFGAHEVDISVLKINQSLLIGIPADFSGELALPLYAYAQQNGLNLIITSFNGGYAGYITQDDRYDLEKYETRTMNWYGPDSGAYFSEIIRRIIDTVAE